MQSYIRQILLDAAHGDAHPLIGLIDYLLEEKELTLKEIIDFAEAHLHIPKETSLNTFKLFI